MMNIWRIILALVLLYSFASEIVSIIKVHGISNGLFGYIFSLIIIVFGSWLLGTGFIGNRFKFKSFEYLKFFIFSLIVFAFSFLINVLKKEEPIHFSVFENVKIPIDDCIKGTKSSIKSFEDRKKYCDCMVNKILSNNDLKEKYFADLESGGINKVFSLVFLNKSNDRIDIISCFGGLELLWTQSIENNLKLGIYEDIKYKGMKDLIDTSTICDCILREYKKYPVKTIIDGDFRNSQLFDSINKVCEGN